MARKERIESVSRALETIELLGQSTRPMSFTEIVNRTRRPKSSVHRLLSTLAHHGFVEKGGGAGPYRLGPMLWGLGLTALGDRDLPTVSRPHLRRLMARSEETVNLAILVRRDASIMYIDKVDGPKMIYVNSPIGLISPSWVTATGRSMLAYRRDVWDRVFSGTLKRLTPNTITDPKQLRSILEKIALDGYAITRGERSIEHGGIASPIRDYSGEVVAACGLALPAFRMNKALIKRFIPMVIEAALAISSALGAGATDVQQRRLGQSD